MALTEQEIEMAERFSRDIAPYVHLEMLRGLSLEEAILEGSRKMLSTFAELVEGETPRAKMAFVKMAQALWESINERPVTQEELDRVGLRLGLETDEEEDRD